MLNIWSLFDKQHVDYPEAEAGNEKYNFFKFKRENSVFRIGHLGTRIITPDSKLELPTGSIMHVLDDIYNKDHKDVPNIQDNLFLERESYKKYIHHIRDLELSGPVKIEDKFIYRPAGLPSVLMKFRSDQGTNFRYLNSIKEIPARNEALTIINHNPIFRVRLFGRLQYLRRIQLILTSILNTVCQVIDQLPEKHQYIFIPWNSEIYDKSMFLRSRVKLDQNSVKRPESFQYIFMMHLLNFLHPDGTTSLFSQIPENYLGKINFVLQHNDKYVFYNLNDLKELYVSDSTYLRVVNHMNLLSIVGKQDEVVSVQDQIIVDEMVSEIVEVKDEQNNLVTESEESTTADAVEIIDTIEDDEKVETVISKITPHIPQVKPDVIKTDKAVHTEPLPHVTTVTSVTKDEVKQSVKHNVVTSTAIRDKSDKTDDISKAYVSELDIATEEYINNHENMTPKEKARMLAISKKYKTLTVGGVKIEDLLLDHNDISLEASVLDENIIGDIPDKSALKSSLFDFDKLYNKKTAKKHLAGVISSFQKNGVYLVDVKENVVVSEMNNYIEYSCKYIDIYNKSSTVKFRIPTVDDEGKILIDGVHQVLKKQRITLPIVKISDTEVSLASNQNKTRIIRNTTKAHSFLSYVDLLVDSGNSYAKVEYGSSSVNLPLPYEYAIISEKYRSIEFVKDSTEYSLIFNHAQRLDHAGVELEQFESIYGVYFGKFGYNLLFVDSENQVHVVDRNGGEVTDSNLESITDVLYLTWKPEIDPLKKILTEWVTVKILDKQFPVMFLLAYRYGLRATLEHLGINYTVTERRSKTIVGESIPSTEGLIDKIKSVIASVKKKTQVPPKNIYFVKTKMSLKDRSIKIVHAQVWEARKGSHKVIDHIPELKDKVYKLTKENIDKVQPTISSICKKSKYGDLEVCFGGDTAAAFYQIGKRIVEDEKKAKQASTESLHDFLPEIDIPENSDYYYHITLDNLGEKFTFTPRIPSVTSATMEDVTIPRICVSTSIEGCILGNPYIFVDPELAKEDPKFRTRVANCWVYAIPKKNLSSEDVVTNEEIVKNRYVFDAHVTDEAWITKEVELKCIGEIRVTNSSKSKEIVYESIRYRDHEGTVAKYTNQFFNKIQYLNELDELGLTPEDYIIGASANAMLYGYPKSANADIDICVSKEAFERIKDRLTPTNRGWNYKHLDIDDIENRQSNSGDEDRWFDFNFDKFKFMTWEVQGYTFLSPYGIYLYYKELYSILQMEKHKPVIEWLDKNLEMLKYNTWLFPYTWTDGPYLEIADDSVIKGLTTSGSIPTQIITSDKKYIPKKGDIQIKFADRTLWFNRYPLRHSLVVAGLDHFDLTSYEMSEFESPDVYFRLLQDKRLSTNYLKGIDNFFDLFIDNMTYNVLKMMKESTNVRDLLLRGVQLLTTLDYRPPSSRENHRLRGYEQFNAILYNEMGRQMATYKNRHGKANVFSINPDAVFLRIIQNASMVPSDAVNPLQDVKESSYITYAGTGGRTAESFVIEDRTYSKDDIGVLSEATPDNHKVAINASLSVDPAITNTMGVLGASNTDELEPANVYSMHMLSFPFTTHDDPKRCMFISQQSSHWIPTEKTERSRVRTGYERTIAHRVGRDYAGVSQQDGTVSNIDTKSKMIEVTYKDGSVDIFKYGEKYLEYQSVYISQNIEHIVQPGQKLKKGDVVTYNTGFFNLDPTTKQLDMSQGVLANVALMEIDTTLEDSSEISKRLANAMAIYPTHLRTLSIPAKSLVHKYVKLGEEILNIDPLLIFEESVLGDHGLPVDNEETLELLADLNKKTPSAKYSGKVVKMDVYYSCDIEEMHPSVQAIVKPIIDRKNREHRLANKTEQANKYPPSGKLPVGSKFKGVYFDKDTVCIMYYIQEKSLTGSGDKLVTALQLKNTISGVFPEPMYTESGMEVDMLFSCSAIANRLVLSPVLLGISNRIMEKLENDVVSMYFNSKEKE